MTLVVFALAHEANLFRKAIGPLPYEVRIELIGLGPSKAKAAMEKLLNADRPRRVILAGVCGGLQDGQQVGDVIVPASVISAGGSKWQCDSLVGPQSGTMTSVDQILSGPPEKRALGQRLKADAVDMEATAIAETCYSAGVPFAVAKAMLDPVGRALPAELAVIFRGGRMRWFRFMWAMLRRPALGQELKKLGGDTTAAVGALAMYLRPYLGGEASTVS